MERPVLKGGRFFDDRGVEYVWAEELGWMRKSMSRAFDWSLALIFAIEIAMLILC